MPRVTRRGTPIPHYKALSSLDMVNMKDVRDRIADAFFQARRSITIFFCIDMKK
jgi:hypothetical protein